MTLVTGRLTVSNSATSSQSPTRIILNPINSFLARMAFFAHGTPALDKIGIRISSRENIIYPAPGSGVDTTTGYAGAHASFGPLPTALEWFNIGQELSGPPYEIRVDIYNEDSAAIHVSILAEVQPEPPEIPVGAQEWVAIIRGFLADSRSEFQEAGPR